MEQNKTEFYTETHPAECYALLPKGKEDGQLIGEIIKVKWGQSGYYRTGIEGSRHTKEEVERLNDEIEVTPNEAGAMHICSMNTLASDGWLPHYNAVLNSLIRASHRREGKE